MKISRFPSKLRTWLTCTSELRGKKHDVVVVEEVDNITELRTVVDKDKDDRITELPTVVDNDKDDRISELPEPILHEILQFLPTKDATRTCVLSKTWNSAWNSFPVFDFDHYKYANTTWKDQYEYRQEKLKETAQDLIDYVNSSIARRCQNMSIQKISFCSSYYYSTATKSRLDFERWLIVTVSKKNVQHLVLSCVEFETQVTRGLFRAKSLKELDLSCCKLNVESGIDHNNIACFSLKVLKLYFVSIDDQTLRSLLSNSCSSLEEVSIRHCNGFRSLTLCSTKLKSAKLYLGRYNVEKITIEAPHLRFLSLGWECANDFLSRGLEATQYIKNLKELELRSVHVTDAVFRVIQGFVHLEKLELICCHMQETIQISSCLAGSARLKNGQLVAYCVGCDIKDDSIGLPVDVKNGFNKLEIIG